MNRNYYHLTYPEKIKMIKLNSRDLVKQDIAVQPPHTQQTISKVLTRWKTTHKVVCLGAGIVGGCTQVVFASKCKNHDFYVVDIDEERIKGWNNFKPNYYEPGLNKLLKTCLNKNLFFTTDFENTLKDATLIFLSVGTPTKQRGEMKGIGTNLSYIESCCHMIAKYAKNEKVIVIEKSTVPVGTAQKITTFLQEYNKKETEKENEKENENENEKEKEKEKQKKTKANCSFIKP
ncbi:udp-glucose dehydrogenase/udp-mannac dehydrogenase [Anaeramoeba flamelloides]|uniref:Udp-glucose dehydrogenase/udp-mannac dehydrogenase n=1 Tax=Anaeramoeba flamelloides TaxID=1746091 RepID=A0ABQ8YRP4_9EUKA|nr:udp-glucose dehydrogenase/udp-mannac dehydrogenase [Anaeramoeba flamelloides]